LNAERRLAVDWKIILPNPGFTGEMIALENTTSILG
jgi:hypothetical protein